MADYPKTAAEYAEQLNAERTAWEQEGPDRWASKLVTDPQHWADYGVHTGEDLARHLAIQNHWDAYKEAYGIRPRGFNYDDMSIEEIEADIEAMMSDASYLDDYEEPYPDSYDHPDPLRKMEPDSPESEVDPYQDTPKRAGMGRRHEGVIRIRMGDLRRIVHETKTKLVR